MDLNGSSFIDIFGLSKTLKKEWHNHYEFLTREYVKHHLKKSDMDWLHCCTFLLGGNCKHSHKENSFIRCLTCFLFFKRKLPLQKNSMKKNIQITRMRLKPWWLRCQSYHVRSHTIIHIVCVPICSFLLWKILRSKWKQIHPSFIWYQTTNRKSCRWDIGRDRLIAMIKNARVCWNLRR